MSATLSFVRAYVRSMRLYFSFVTGIAGWLITRADGIAELKASVSARSGGQEKGGRPA